MTNREIAERAAVHGFKYTGPSYGPELEAAKAAIAK